MSRQTNKYFLFFRIAITIFIFFALFKLVPYQKLAEVCKESHKGYLLLGFVLYFPCYIIGAARWRYILASLDIHITFKEAFSALFCGLFLIFFSLPLLAVMYLEALAFPLEANQSMTLLLQYLWTDSVGQ